MEMTNFWSQFSPKSEGVFLFKVSIKVKIEINWRLPYKGNKLKRRKIL